MASKTVKHLGHPASGEMRLVNLMADDLLRTLVDCCSDRNGELMNHLEGRRRIIEAFVEMWPIYKMEAAKKRS